MTAANARSEMLAPARTREFGAYVGMSIFLGVFGMTFAALFFSYAVLRVGAPTWPPDGAPRLPIALPAFNTLLLVISSFTYHRCHAAVRAGRSPMKWLLSTVALGATFLGLQLVVWFSVYASGLHADSGVYGSVFYALTVFHAVHVLCGLGVLLGLWPGLARGKYTRERHSAVRLTGMFWHFVDAVWVLTFLTVYVL